MIRHFGTAIRSEGSKMAESGIWLSHPLAIPEGKRTLVTKVWEKVIEGGEIQSIRIFEDRSKIHRTQT